MIRDWPLRRIMNRYEYYVKHCWKRSKCKKGTQQDEQIGYGEDRFKEERKEWCKEVRVCMDKWVMI